MSTISTTGVGTNLRVQWRTGWKGVAAWVIGLAAVVLLTATSITDLYDTPAKLRSYADSSATPAIRMLNGDVAGLGTLGGTLANELGFVFGFGLPVMAIALTVRGTRREEEAGRLELLLASRMGRQAPLVAAIIMALVAFVALGGLTAAIFVASGTETTGALVYGAAILALGAVFVGVTAVLAQAFSHSRSVWGAGLAIMLAAYIVRGAGAVDGTWLVWLSPHGWYDEVAAFGEAQVLPFAISAVVALLLVAVALLLSTRRDVGASLVAPSTGPGRATPALVHPFGLAVRDRRGGILGWALLVAVLLGTYGALTQTVIDAVKGNPDLAAFLAAGEEGIVKSMSAMFVLLLSMFISGYVLQSLGSLRGEETSGRLELQLSAPRSRIAWLLPHLVVVAVGTLVVAAIGGLALALSTSAALDDASWVGTLLRATAAHLPVALLLGGLSVALFGWLPRLQPAVWAVFAVAAVIGYMGPGLDLPDALVEWSPFGLVGNVPAEDVDVTGALVAGIGGLVLVGLGLLGLTRRDLPHR